MAQHRKGAVVYAAQDAQKAKDDFWLELDHRCLDKGMTPGPTALSRLTTVQPQSIRFYRVGKTAMPVDTLQAWVKALAPDIRVVLRFLGYSDKQIHDFAEREAQ